jgi:hypothetical protein
MQTQSLIAAASRVVPFVMVAVPIAMLAQQTSGVGTVKPSAAQSRSDAERRSAQRDELLELRSHAPAATSAWSSLNEMHRYFTAAFIATPGMGGGRMVAVGLLPNRDQRLLLSDEEGTANVPQQSRGDGAWVVRELELIGIAKHDQPVLFSFVAHGTAASQRPLTPFEQKAVGALQRGGTIISHQSADEIEAVGAIRAQKECVQCHRPYREGDVLGALRYVLRRP